MDQLFFKRIIIKIIFFIKKSKLFDGNNYKKLKKIFFKDFFIVFLKE